MKLSDLDLPRDLSERQCLGFVRALSTPRALYPWNFCASRSVETLAERLKWVKVLNMPPRAPSIDDMETLGVCTYNVNMVCASYSRCGRLKSAVVVYPAVYCGVRVLAKQIYASSNISFIHSKV